jgi:pimeloyl-ACP methyl ester carboxylesterase
VGGERLIEAGGLELRAQAFGDPADPAVLLVMGTGGSMLWWDGAFWSSPSTIRRACGPSSSSARPRRSVATLVVHGTADQLFPIEHGEVLASAIPGARLLRLEGAGHGVEPADWETLAAAIADHPAEG